MRDQVGGMESRQMQDTAEFESLGLHGQWIKKRSKRLSLGNREKSKATRGWNTREGADLWERK